MNITFIIGNGFDIQCGLESRYSDFLKEYTVVQEGDSENIKAFKAYLAQSENQELWSDAEKAMGIHFGDFSNCDIDDYTERIVDFQFKMMDYLEAQQRRCFWEKEKEISQVFSGFLRESFADVISSKRDELVAGVSGGRNRYKFITFNYTNVLDKIVSSCNGSVSRRVNRLNRRVEILDEISSIYHVHGTLDSSIIMGVNDVGQIRSGDKVVLTDQLKRQMVKPEMNSALGHGWDGPAMTTIRESNMIVIYGVSFGATDNIWWEAIREWLEASNTHTIVAFVRSKKIWPSYRLAWQVVNYEEEESPKILEKLGFEKDHPKYEQLLKQVHTIPNTTRLDLKPLLMGDGVADESDDLSDTPVTAGVP